MSRPHHRPTQKTSAFFDAVEGGADPALVTEAGDRAATLLVRGSRASDDEAARWTVVERQTLRGRDEGTGQQGDATDHQQPGDHEG